MGRLVIPNLFLQLLCPGPYIFTHVQVRGPEAAFFEEEVMKVKAVMVFSGFMMTAIAFLLLWQLLVVALLIHGVDEVIGVFGRLV